jgi:hypothetical protein
VLSQQILPTYESVLLAIFEETSKSNKNIAFSRVSHEVATQIEEIFSKASIPTVSHELIVKMIKDYHSKYYNLGKSFNRDEEKINYQVKLENFVSEAKNKLFDVAFCKCIIEFTCTCGTKLISCDCKLIIKCACEKKNPKIERQFMYDQ